MSSSKPWSVRHLYTATDERYQPYLNALRTMLKLEEPFGNIDRITDAPVASGEQIAASIARSELPELVIVDLHGWADSDGVWLGAAPEDGWLDLAEVPSSSWKAAVVVLTGCRGFRRRFRSELARIIAYPVALVGHFDEAAMNDHTPVEMIRTLTRNIEGGDWRQAVNEIDAFLYNREKRTELWAVEPLRPDVGMTRGSS